MAEGSNFFLRQNIFFVMPKLVPWRSDTMRRQKVSVPQNRDLMGDSLTPKPRKPTAKARTGRVSQNDASRIEWEADPDDAFWFGSCMLDLDLGEFRGSVVFQVEWRRWLLHDPEPGVPVSIPCCVSTRSARGLPWTRSPTMAFPIERWSSARSPPICLDPDQLDTFVRLDFPPIVQLTVTFPELNPPGAALPCLSRPLPRWMWVQDRKATCTEKRDKQGRAQIKRQQRYEAMDRDIHVIALKNKYT